MPHKDKEVRREFNRRWMAEARRGAYGIKEYTRRRTRNLLAQRERIREELKKLGE